MGCSSRPLGSALFLLLSGCQCLVPVEERAPTPLEAWCAALTPAAVCGRAQACQGVAPGVGCEDVTNAEAQRYTTLCTPRLLGDVDAGVVVFDADAGRACLERLQTVCGAEDCSAGVFHGTREVGSSCQGALQCRDGAWCELARGCLGICRAAVADGDEPGTFLPRACTSSSASTLRDGGIRCRARAGEQQRCELARDELTGVGCRAGLACISGSCAAVRAEGEPCVSAGECGPGLWCDEALHACLKRPGLGESCATRQCLIGTVCETGTRVCAPLRHEGAACTSRWWECEAPFTCLLGRCARLGQIGAACAGYWDCESPLACRSGACARASEEGEACTDSKDCLDGRGCERGVCTPSCE